jgi:hypothetical protein
MAKLSVPTTEKLMEVLKQKDDEKQKKESAVALLAMEHKRELAAKEKEMLTLKGKIAQMTAELGKAAERAKSKNRAQELMDELVEKYNCEPAAELMKLVNETTEVTDEEGNVVIDHADGTPALRYVMTVAQRTDLLLKLMEYRMPKLRASDNQNTMDMNISVTIKRFDESKVAKVLEIE